MPEISQESALSGIVWLNVSDASPSPSPDIIDETSVNTYYGTINSLGILPYNDEPVDIIPIANNIFNGFCYTHAFFRREYTANSPTNGFLGIFYLYCMIKFAIDSNPGALQHKINMICPYKSIYKDYKLINQIIH